MHFLELDSDLCVCYSLFLNILLQTRFVKTRLTSNRNASNLLKKTFLESRRIMFFKGLNEAYHCNGQPFVYLDTETKHFQRFLMIMTVRKYMYRVATTFWDTPFYDIFLGNCHKSRFQVKFTMSQCSKLVLGIFLYQKLSLLGQIF